MRNVVYLMNASLDGFVEGPDGRFDWTRLVRGDPAAEVARLKEQPGGDLGVSGPGLASTLARLGLVDEFRLVVCPVLVGSGKPYFPVLDRSVPLRLLETQAFRSGTVYLRYQRA